MCCMRACVCPELCGLRGLRIGTCASAACCPHLHTTAALTQHTSTFPPYVRPPPPAPTGRHPAPAQPAVRVCAGPVGAHRGAPPPHLRQPRARARGAARGAGGEGGAGGAAPGAEAGGAAGLRPRALRAAWGMREAGPGVQQACVRPLPALAAVAMGHTCQPFDSHPAPKRPVPAPRIFKRAPSTAAPDPGGDPPRGGGAGLRAARGDPAPRRGGGRGQGLLLRNEGGAEGQAAVGGARSKSHAPVRGHPRRGRACSQAGG